MKLKQGNILDDLDLYDLVCFTSNSSLDKQRNLVMGAGSALDFKTRFPGLPKLFGEAVRAREEYGDYGLIVAHIESKLIGAFQTKAFWRDKSETYIIKLATTELFSWIVTTGNTVACPFPGIGELKREEVLPIISLLPDNVTFYEKE